MVFDVRYMSELIQNKIVKMNSSKFTSKNKVEKRVDGFSVSQVSYDCYRKIYFDMISPSKAPEDKLGRFVIGDIVGDIIQEAFEEIGGKSEVMCEKTYDFAGNEIRIVGHTDVLFDDVIIEIKSVSPFAWKYIVGGSIRGNWHDSAPKIAHIRQLNTYLDLNNVSDGLLLYVNKDDFSLKFFSIKHNEELMQNTISKCAYVKASIVHDLMPLAIKGNECNWCGHKEKCKGA